MNILTFLIQIPATVWSGVFASLMTLAGVLIANKSNTTRLKMQFDHDAKQKAAERTATMRREIYMKGAEELAKATHHLANLPLIDPIKDNIGDGLQDFLRVATKMQLVAHSRTGLLIGQLVAAYSSVMMRLAIVVRPIHNNKIAISISDEQAKRAQAEVTRVTSELRKFTESAQTDQVVFAALQRAMDFHQEVYVMHSEKNIEAWGKHNALLIPFYQQLLTELRAIAPMQIAVMIEIRKDLDLTTDIDEYREQMKNAWDSMESLLEKTLRELMSE